MTEFQDVATGYNVTHFAVPPSYPSRFRLPDSQTGWNVTCDSYAPPSYTHPDLLIADYADPESITKGEIQDRVLEDEVIAFNEIGRPLLCLYVREDLGVYLSH
jgi:hypothetical protein